MANKALVVGIGEYNNGIPPLDGAVPSAKLWEDLLRDEFGYSVTTLPEPTATLSTVTGELKDLLRDATEADRLVFVFCGHGGKVPNAQGGKDEALVLSHPYRSNAAAASLTDTAFGQILKDHPRHGASLTLVLDACYSGGFEVKRLKRVLLWILKVFSLERRVQSPRHIANDDRTDVRSFGMLYALPASVPRPLIIAASRKDESAAQLPTAGMGMVFSSAAVRAIKSKPSISPQELVETVNSNVQPLQPQTATLLGDRTRDAKPIFT